jgi:hypothetical protein
MRYLLAIVFISVIGCAAKEYKPGDITTEITPDEYVYFEKELSENVYLIEVAGDSWYATKNMLSAKVEASWDRRAGELCPNGIESKKFEILHPSKTYFEELRCRDQSCLDGVVGHGVVTCKE